MLNAELEENQELANSRMAELEKLQQEMQQGVRTNEKLKVVLVEGVWKHCVPRELLFCRGLPIQGWFV